MTINGNEINTLNMMKSRYTLFHICNLLLFSFVLTGGIFVIILF